MKELAEPAIKAVKEDDIKFIPKRYDFTNPIDEIYYQMWLEEEFPYYQFNIEMDSFSGKPYNMNVYNGIQEWKKINRCYK